MTNTTKGPQVSVWVEEYPHTRHCVYVKHFIRRKSKFEQKIKLMRGTGWELSCSKRQPIYSGSFRAKTKTQCRDIDIDHETVTDPLFMSEMDWNLLLFRYDLSDLDISILKILKDVLDNKINEEDAESALINLFTVQTGGT